jgi:hypothetical protein
VLIKRILASVRRLSGGQKVLGFSSEDRGKPRSPEMSETPNHTVNIVEELVDAVSSLEDFCKISRQAGNRNG